MTPLAIMESGLQFSPMITFCGLDLYIQSFLLVLCQYARCVYIHEVIQSEIEIHIH